MIHPQKILIWSILDLEADWLPRHTDSGLAHLLSVVLATAEHGPCEGSLFERVWPCDGHC